MITRYKRFLSAFLVLVLCVGILPITGMARTVNGLDNFVKTAAYSDSTFTDVHKDDWFYENVRSVYEYALMRGKGNNCFAPESNVTIAEVITIAARLHAQYYIGTNVFIESEPWYQTYADYAENYGILEEIPDNLSAPATRGEFAEIIFRALPESALEEINIVAYSGIPDVSLADSYGRAVYKLYRAGIMIGNDATGTFAPESNIKRSEVAAIVTRMVVPALRKSVQLGEEYTVSFDLGYRGLKLEEQTVVQGYAAEEPEKPTRQNYIFEGWYTAKTGGYKFAFETEILSDMTLYARWKIDPAWFAVMMNGMIDGDKEDENEPEEAYDYGKLPYRPGKSWEELIECNDGEEPYIEMNDNDQIGLYIGKISDNKVEDVYDVIAELNNVRDLLNINDARFEFVPSYDDGRIDDKSYRVQQVYNGVQVWCAQIVVIVDDDGYINGFISNYVDYVRYSSVETEPAVSMSEAIDIAVAATETNEEYEIFTETVLIVEPDKGLLWYVTVSNGNNSWWYWINAAEGDIVCNQIIGDTFAELDLDSYQNLKDEQFTFWGATVNLISFENDGNVHYQLYDRTTHDNQAFGISIHNMNDIHSNGIDIAHDINGQSISYPGNIYENADNSWDVNDFSQRQALYASYNFHRVAKQYQNMHFYIDLPLEININLHLNNAAYCGINSTNDAIQFVFGNFYTDNNDQEYPQEYPRELDTIGHEYTHMVQDYYINAVNDAHWSGNSLGNSHTIQDSSDLDWVESKAISEGTADIMGMLIEAICEGNTDNDGGISDIDSFLSYGESIDGIIARDHTAKNEEGNNTVDEMVQYYTWGLRNVTFTRDFYITGNSIFGGTGFSAGQTVDLDLYDVIKYDIPNGVYKVNSITPFVYGQGPGHIDGYIVVGILRNLIEKTNISAQRLLELWHSTISMLNPLSEFDSLRFALIASAEKVGLDSYVDDIINACTSVGITGNEHNSAEYNTWYYEGLAKAYNNGIITENDALNNANVPVTRREYLELLVAMCEKVGVDVDSDVVAWAKALEVIGDTWTGDYLRQSIPRWQATLLMYQIFNRYHKEFKDYGWKVVYGYAFVSEVGTDHWQNFKDVKFDDWGTSVTGINVSEMVQYYRGCAVYSVDTKQLSNEESIKAFQEQYMASKSTSKTYVTGANDEDTRQAMYYMGFYQLWLNGMFHGSSSSGKVLLGTTDSISLGEACALITQVIPD